jgi:hypothetical protein
MAGMIGPLTPVLSFQIHNAKTHDEVYDRINSSQGIQHLHNEVYPITDLEEGALHLQKWTNGDYTEINQELLKNEGEESLLYWCWSRIREGIDISKPEIAKSLLGTIRTIQQLEKYDKVERSYLVGPLTPFSLLHIEKAKSHEALFKRITQLPGIPYMHTEIKPVIDLTEVESYLKRHVDAYKKNN